MNKIRTFQVILLLTLIIIIINACAFIAAGSNLMAERYQFEISKDSLTQRIKLFNASQNSKSQDSIFKIDKDSLYFYEGYIDDDKNGESYFVLIPNSLNQIQNYCLYLLKIVMVE